MLTQMQITPEMAESFLERNGSNRPVREATLREYTHAMREGRWKLNGESLKFDRGGNVLDGQHRLLACIKSGRPFFTFVVTNLDHESFDTIDIGHKRSPGDILYIGEGVSNAHVLASAVKWVETIRGRFPSNKFLSLPADKVRALFLSMPEIADSVIKASHCKKILPIGAAVALHYEFSRRDKVAADKFFDDLANGINLTKLDPVYIIREWLIANSGKGTKQAFLPGEKVARVIRAWNHRRANFETRMIKGVVRKQDGTYELPEIS